MSKHTVSVIIPAFNEEKTIRACLKTALANSAPFHEIIVVDNNSTDNTAIIAGAIPGVRVIHETRKGPSFARQRGYEESSGSIIAFVDADNHIPVDWCKKILDEFNTDSKLACLSGPYLYYDLARWRNFFVKLFWVLSMPAYYLVGYLAVGGNMAIRRDVLEKMNGIDTSIAFYGDDTNMARRASQFGKMKFRLSLPMYSSARRFAGQGLLKTELFYIGNFFSEAFLKRPVTKEYKDIR